MNEKQTSDVKVIRPTKRQKELLNYIDGFIKYNGYSPSFREIMHGLNYSSVATVANHIDNLIKRGHIVKRDRSARSLELVDPQETAAAIKSNQIKASDEKWLIEKVEHFFKEVENGAHDVADLDRLYVLVGALKVLGLDGAAQSFIPRLTELKKQSD